MILAFHADVPGSNAGQSMCHAEDPGGRTIFLSSRAAGKLDSSLRSSASVRVFSEINSMHTNFISDCRIHIISSIVKYLYYYLYI